MNDLGMKARMLGFLEQQNLFNTLNMSALYSNTAVYWTAMTNQFGTLVGHLPRMWP